MGDEERPGPSSENDEERRMRAGELRKEIERLERGLPADENGRPRRKTPREFTEPREVACDNDALKDDDASP